MTTKATRCNSRREVDEGGPGCYFIDRERAGRPRIYMRLPGDPLCCDLSLAPLAGEPHWDMTGTDDCPTLTPSVRTTDGHFNWHGYLRAGQFETC